MTYRVLISDCVSQYHRAHNALIDSLGGSHHIASTSQRGQSHWRLMENNWQKKYHARPVAVNGCWKYLDFPSEKHYLAFILKWS